jgi:flagellar biosynthesis/type III secretory pathway protein FliH
MLATLASQAAVRLVVATADATRVRAVLAELAADCGFKGHIELVADPRLTAGAVQLLWPDGWLEHAPETIRHQVDAILAAHRAPEPGPSLSGACPCSAEISSGDDHALA